MEGSGGVRWEGEADGSCRPGPMLFHVKQDGRRAHIIHACADGCESYTIRPFEPDGCKKTTCARQCE